MLAEAPSTAIRSGRDRDGDASDVDRPTVLSIAVHFRS
ncbi:hypothetical protein MKSMC1_19270 [Mycobacterium kansasii]|nr:hypothetical protein MKSMC1_19270 [Mycobacterium kansasii]